MIIAEDRAGRPNDYTNLLKVHEPSITKRSESSCPFCPGHEQQTPEPLFVAHDSQGDWQVRVVPNKYPAVSTDAPSPALAELESSLFVADQPFGVHEVIIESPRHVHDITDMTSEEFATVIKTYRSRIQHWSQDDRIQHTIVFKNVGFAAGASLEHSHSQLLALPELPQVMQDKVRGGQKHFAENKTCIYCDLLEQEIARQDRIVFNEGSFVVCTSYAGRQPYESLIIPSCHTADFGEIDDSQCNQLAELLQKMVVRLNTLIPDLSYNLILHTRPHREDLRKSFHWHMELIPRTTRLAGLEFGTGLFVNPMSPERAAANLRNCQPEQTLGLSVRIQ